MKWADRKGTSAGGLEKLCISWCRESTCRVKEAGRRAKAHNPCRGEIPSEWELSRKQEATKEMDKTETENWERKHTKEEVKTRQMRDAVALECMHSPLSSTVAEKIKVRFLPNISTGYSSNVPNLYRLA